MSHHDKGQCIHCNVGSCTYNERQSKCSLESIQVSAKTNVGSGQPDESMCSSYKCRGK